MPWLPIGPLVVSGEREMPCSAHCCELGRSIDLRHPAFSGGAYTGLRKGLTLPWPACKIADGDAMRENRTEKNAAAWPIQSAAFFVSRPWEGVTARCVTMSLTWHHRPGPVYCTEVRYGAKGADKCCQSVS